MTSLSRTKFILILFIFILLTGCSLFSPVQTTPPNMYVLNALPCDVPIKKKSSISLFVMPPETISAFNTTQMAYSEQPFQIGYYGLNRWVSTPGQMLFPLLVQTLQNTHHFHAIVAPPCVNNYDYILCTQVLVLLQNYTCENCIFEFVLRAQIINSASGKVVATKVFFIKEPITEINPYAGVVAANCATKTLLREVARFVLRNI